MEIQLIKYGELISDKALGDIILSKIENVLSSSSEVVLDFENVKSMATYNAKQIFGELYTELGPKDFFSKIKFKNLSSSLSSIIRLGISDSLNNLKEA